MQYDCGKIMLFRDNYIHCKTKTKVKEMMSTRFRIVASFTGGEKKLKLGRGHRVLQGTGYIGFS